jgi:diguanylate cyclase (GGDEF)-like protein
MNTAVLDGKVCLDSLDAMAEERRLAELSCYRVTFEHNDPILDTLTQLAVDATAGDIAGISLLYRSELWLASRIGVNVAVMPRAGSLCTYAIQAGTDDVYEIEDASIDPRFRHNPLVDNPHPFRHYASVPLRGSHGYMLGTLWIMHHAPARLSVAQSNLFRGLARLVVESLELRYNNDVTGMSNRTVFLHHLQLELERRRAPHIVVGYVDLIAFRQINELFGRESGDSALRIIGERLVEWAGPENLVSHLGGAKYAFALLQDSASAARRIEALGAALSEPVQLEESGAHRVRARVGIAHHDTRSHTLAISLLDAADTAASTISSTVRQTTIREFGAELLARSRVIFELQGALDGDTSFGEIMPYYQPQVDFAKGSIIGMEALVRWQHPAKGLILPDEFVELAESTGKIYQLENLVLEKICSDLRQWVDAGLDPAPVSFNYSRTSLLNNDVIPDFQRTLARYAIPTHLLELEVTETQLLENFQSLSSRVAQFRALGVRIAVDDFGTGHSNLDAISSFHFDRLKVDRQFVDGVSKNDRSAGLFYLIQGIADLFNAELLCEGLEQPEDLRWLTNHGVVLVQGWYFSTARPAAEIARILKTFRDRSPNAPSLDPAQLKEFLNA